MNRTPYSHRFGRPIIVTRHADDRRAARKIGSRDLILLIETGEIRYKDDRHAWVAMAFAGRTDNLICAAIKLEAAVVIKTVMHHFAWNGQT